MSRRILVIVCTSCILGLLGCEESDNKDPESGGTGGGKAGSGGKGGGGGTGGGTEIHKLDRSGFTDVGTTDPLDYGTPEMWLCRPDIDPNECARNIDATELKPDGTRALEKHERAEKPEVDCFFVYPSVFMTGAPQMVDFSEAGVKLTLDPLLSQGARFSRVCELYAPLYRQVGLVGGQPVAGGDNELAEQDVRDAFAYYLEHLNHGRKFVLVGHSQGTFILTTLVQKDIDEKAAVRDQMLSAVMLGGRIAVPKGQLKGDTFKNVPLCSAKAETGCVIAYSSYSADAAPTMISRFGKAMTAGSEGACVEPGVIAGNSGAYAGSYFPTTLENPSFASDTKPPADITTPFVVYREMFKGECKTLNEFRYLEYKLLTPADDPRGIPPWRHTAIDVGLGFGTHLVDFNIAMEELIDAVAAQIATLKK